ncbi:NAD-dependent epimerase/dehydratase family protein [Flavobacterium sp. CYK-4]|uniref:NAD-dependent epimerase/dehydratase family protein n=1 Tax=Flavobacterium lotistagni TaxID=2709660 RepID=UPI001407BAEF|nr:NAD-dependent epimerase/dehydratase family protein [Flavobacterium lotistagni]NHM06701.1 NAD-dependent epimerase/dehydratase family protein [Flavobacterium lotistagni]
MILVTGATGLVGSHLVLQLLENRQQVRAIYRSEKSLGKVKSLFQFYGKLPLFEQVQWVRADILDIPALELAFHHIEQVYHCAALISFDPADENALRKTNIEGTANVVNLSLAFGVKQLCYVSSIAALGDLKSYEAIIDETTEWNPEVEHSDYAISKYGAEMEVWRGWQEGLSVRIINPGVIIGPGFWDSGSGKLFSQIADGFSFYTKGITGWVGVKDVVKSLIQSMESEQNGQRYIVVAANQSYEIVLKLIAEALQVKIPNRYAKPWMTEIYWRLDKIISLLSGRKRTLSRITARTLHQEHHYDNAKIKSELGLEFRTIPDCILEAAQAFQKTT